MDASSLERLEDRSLKARCIETLERLIISGELAVGEAIPPERELAKRLGISRPVVHEAMVELAAKGFVTVTPRRGVRVNDYYHNGTLAVFEAIVLNNEGRFPPEVLADVVAFRRLIELEAVRLAAGRSGGDSLADIKRLLDDEDRLGDDGAALGERTELDIRFHLLLVQASGSLILPLVANSIEPVYRSLVRRFYSLGPDLALVRGFHHSLVDALARGDADAAVEIDRPHAGSARPRQARAEG